MKSNDQHLFNRIRELQEMGCKFPCTDTEASKYRGIGKRGVLLMKSLGLVTTDWDRVKLSISILESRADEFEKKAASIRKQVKELRSSIP